MEILTSCEGSGILKKKYWFQVGSFASTRFDLNLCFPQERVNLTSSPEMIPTPSLTKTNSLCWQPSQASWSLLAILEPGCLDWRFWGESGSRKWSCKQENQSQGLDCSLDYFWNVTVPVHTTPKIEYPGGQFLDRENSWLESKFSDFMA